MNNKNTGGLGISRLVLVAQAPRAQVQLLHLAVDHDGSRVNIRRPVTFGVSLGMADVMTVLRRFTA